MRWLFSEPGADDYPAKQTAIARIGSWWKAFGQRAGHLTSLFRQESNWDLPAWMEQTLQAIHPELRWEYGPAVNGEGHRLVITPESQKELRMLTAAILHQAPKLPGWEFYGYRQPESLEIAQMMVEARCRSNMSLDGMLVRPSVGSGHRVDLQFYSPHARGVDHDDDLAVVFVAAESILGEEVLDKWIGAINVEPLPKGGFLSGLMGKSKPTNLLPLSRLRDTVKAVAGSIIDQLPPEPIYKHHAGLDWSVYQREPEEAEEYAGREDVIGGIALDVEMVHAMQSGQAFYSQRFSRTGERFCYLKLDGEERPIEERFEERGEFEEALNEVLVGHNLGCHVGGATGLRYAYIDLALVDLKKGVEAVRHVLRGRVAPRSWLLFHDDDWSGEWCGIYPNTPPPPNYS